MLVESGLLLAATSAGMIFREYKSKARKLDKQMHGIIKEIFENMGFGIRKGRGKNAYVEFPRLLNSAVHKSYVSLVYKLPLGINLALIDKLKESIQEATGTDNMTMSVAGKSTIKMKIATTTMPDRVPLAPFIGNFKNWEVPIGVHQFGIETHNFDYYPVLVGGGVIRFGKSTFIKNILTCLITQNPDDVEFYILDLKEGVEFSEYKNLKQVKEVATNLTEAVDLLERLDGQLTKASEWFLKKGYKNIVETPVKKRKFVIVDESHELAPPSHADKKEKKPYQKCQYLLSRIVSKGGFCGFRCLIFTQYPVAESISQRIKQNSPARITLRVADSTASRVILDEHGAEDLPPVRGRAIYKTFQKTVLQIPYSQDHYKEFLLPYVEEKEEVIESVNKADVTPAGGTDIIEY